MLLRKSFRFEASHVLPKHPGKCSRLHGHSWVLHVSVEGPIDPLSGFVMDYAEISKWVGPIVESLDHRHLGTWDAFEEYLNGVPTTDKYAVENLDFGFYPSSENLLHWIGYQLVSFPWTSLALEETCTSYAELSRKEFDTLATRNEI